MNLWQCVIFCHIMQDSVIISLFSKSTITRPTIGFYNTARRDHFDNRRNQGFSSSIRNPHQTHSPQFASLALDPYKDKGFPTCSSAPFPSVLASPECLVDLDCSR